MERKNLLFRLEREREREFAEWVKDSFTEERRKNVASEERENQNKSWVEYTQNPDWLPFTHITSLPREFVFLSKKVPITCQGRISTSRFSSPVKCFFQLTFTHCLSLPFIPFLLFPCLKWQVTKLHLFFCSLSCFVTCSNNRVQIDCFPHSLSLTVYVICFLP